MTNYKHRARHGGKLWQFAIHTSNPKTGLIKVKRNQVDGFFKMNIKPAIH